MRLFSLMAAACFVITVAATAGELPAMKAAVDEFRKATAHGPSEAARLRLVTELTRIRQDDVARGRGHGLLTTEQWQAIDREMARHPMPAPADPKALAKLLTGKWQSPRHDYLYRADGTWTMLPAYEDGEQSTHGRWRIEGNVCTESVSGMPLGRYTIILLDRESYVVTDGQVTFYQTRLSK